MTTVVLQIHKVTAAPSTWQPNSVYFIAPTGSSAGYMEVYVTSSDGTAQRHTPTQAEIQAWINTSISSANNIKVVADIAARNALSPTSAQWVFVKNATDDNTVASGGATYLWDTTTSTWVKTSEAESLDIVQTWAALQNKPTSTVAQIDAAVGVAHTHANKTQIDKIGEDAGGNPTYNNSLPHAGWDTVGW